MSASTLATIAVAAAAAAAKAIIEELLTPEEREQAWTALSEKAVREAYDAKGNVKLAARKARKR